MQKPSTDSL